MRRFIAWMAKRDFLEELQYAAVAGWLVIVLSVSTDVLNLVNGEVIRTPIGISQESPPVFDLPPGVEPAAVGNIEVLISSPTDRQVFLYLLTKAPTAILLLIAMVLLNLMLYRARRDGPFTKRSIRFLRWIGVTIWAGMIGLVIESFANTELTRTISPDAWVYTMELPYGWLFGGFVCFAAAEMVRRGISLRDELETVI